MKKIPLKTAKLVWKFVDEVSFKDTKEAEALFEMFMKLNMVECVPCIELPDGSLYYLSLTSVEAERQRDEDMLKLFKAAMASWFARTQAQDYCEYGMPKTKSFKGFIKYLFGKE